MAQNNELSELVQGLTEYLQHMTPEERAIVDAIIVGADTSGDGQMEILLALRSGCKLEELVAASYKL